MVAALAGDALYLAVAVDARERLDGFERADAVVQKGEDVAGVGVQHVVVGHHVDDGVGAQPLLAQFQQVADELPLGTATVGGGLAVTVHEVLGEVEHPLAGGVVQLRQPFALKEDIEGCPFERALGEARLQVGGELAVVLDVYLVGDGHAYRCVRDCRVKASRTRCTRRLVRWSRCRRAVADRAVERWTGAVSAAAQQS